MTVNSILRLALRVRAGHAKPSELRSAVRRFLRGGR